MAPGDEKLVAERVVAALKGAVRTEAKPPLAPTGDVSGSWDVKIEFAASTSTHALYLRQRGSEIEGMHQGDFVTREARGRIDGDQVEIRSHQPETFGDSISFTFTGKLAGDTIQGELDMGEYLKARFSAKRHEMRRVQNG
jgi:L-seryl-tRNA(Ser) seleniumtransferase